MDVNRKVRETEELDITPMIDCVFQLILFFMVIIALVVVVGIAIRFPEAQGKNRDRKKPKKILYAYVQRDRIDPEHNIISDGVVKVVKKDFLLSSAQDSAARAKEYKESFEAIKAEINRLIKEEEFKSDQIIITGDVTSYHWKIVKLIDLAKQCGVKGFSLTPPK